MILNADRYDVRGALIEHALVDLDQLSLRITDEQVSHLRVGLAVSLVDPPRAALTSPQPDTPPTAIRR